MREQYDLVTGKDVNGHYRPLMTIKDIVTAKPVTVKTDTVGNKYLYRKLHGYEMHIFALDLFIAMIIFRKQIRALNK